jgi:AsmA family
MRIRTIILLALGAIIIVLAAGAWWLYSSRDVLIKRAIEHYGPQLTGVAVTVKSVKLEPLDGTGAINGLELGNPQGFSAAHALSLGQARLAVEPATLTSAVVHIKEISLEAPAITYERGPQGDNLSAIQKHIQSQLPKSEPNAKGASKDAPQRKFIVDHVQVRQAKVSYGGLATVELPDVHLRDLGKRKGGGTAAELADEVWKELSRVAIARAPAAIEGLRDKAKDAAERLRGILK